MPAIGDAFEYLSSLQSATTRDALIDALHAASNRLGLPAVALLQCTPDGGDEGVVTLLSRLPEGAATALAGLAPTEALHRLLLTLDRPTRLSESLTEWTGAAAELAGAGLTGGVAIPVRLPEGARGAAVLLGEDVQFAENDMLVLVALVQTAVAQLGHLNPEASAAAMLTPREREVLRWTAAGKTADASASILGISVRTVEYHLLNAARKLNTANRTHTVVEALRSRQISL